MKVAADNDLTESQIVRWGTEEKMTQLEHRKQQAQQPPPPPPDYAAAH